MAFRQLMTCFVCNHNYNMRAMRRIPMDDQIKIQIAIDYRNQSNENNPAEFTNASRVCINCDNLLNQEINYLQIGDDCVSLSVLRNYSSGVCMVCQSPDGQPRLPISAAAKLYIEKNIYIPPRTRCCVAHLNTSGYLDTEFFSNLQIIQRPYRLKGIELMNFLKMLRKQAKPDVLTVDTATDEDFAILSPVNKEQFEQMFQACVAVPEGTVSRKTLLMFLLKLRQGLSDDLLKVLFNYQSRQLVSKIISVVRQSLSLRFVPESIGLNSTNRQRFISEHVTPFANALYNTNETDPKAIVIVDTTYSFIERASNFKSLRKSFSRQKNRHLVKPGLIVAPDGYILDIHGPYFTNHQNNDASIIQNEFERDEGGLDEWFLPGDIFLVDKGYRDAVPYLESKGIICKMPASLERGERQLSTAKANESRTITKMRWIVESRNGHIKSIFKFFDGIIPRAHVLHLGDFLKIAGGIINRFHDNIQMEDATVLLGRELKERASTEENVVLARIQAENMLRRNAIWTRLHQNQLPTFPILDLDYLKKLTVGTYQVGLAPAYVQDKLDIEATEVFELDELTQEYGFLRVRIYSRYRNSTKHQLWIAYRYDILEEDVNDDSDAILGYYCTCQTGARTIGCCAHIASVLWYMGYARHTNNIKYPSTTLLAYIQDCTQMR